MALTQEQFTKLKAQLASQGPASAPEPSLLTRVANSFRNTTSTYKRAVAGEGEFSGHSDIRRGFEAAAVGAGGIIDAAKEALPAPVRNTLDAAGEKIGEGFTALTDRIGDSAQLQQWVTQHPDAAQKLEEVLGTAGAAGEIAGTVLGGKAAGAGIRSAAMRTADAAARVPSPSKVLDIIVSSDRIKNVRLALTNLEPQAETILKQTTLPEFESYYRTAAKAAVDPRSPTPLELAGERAKQALNKVQEKLTAAGTAKSDMMKVSGISPFEGPGITQFKQGLQTYLNRKTPIEGDAKIIKDVRAQLTELGDTPSAGQVDRFIDFVQDRIYSGKADLTIPVTDQTAAALRNMVGKLNEALKQQLPDRYRTLNDDYARFIQIRNELNTKLGKEGERGGSLMKRVFSPSDANTKQLFEDIRKETGIDLVKEATLAKFVMEGVGDVRQKSLLKQLDIVTQGVSRIDLTKPGTWLDFLREQADLNPADAAREVIRRSSDQ
jgi:hypothetical protein